MSAIDAMLAASDVMIYKRLFVYYWAVKMPRTKTLSDEALLDAANQLMHERGPAAVTFAALAETTGLSASTLVQRFGSKQALVHGALVRAWDQLDRHTAELAASVPKTPQGAVTLLTGLSGGYGDIETYADNLLILREDLRDPVLRARGAAWKAALADALDACFTDAPPGIGLAMATQWQGALLWWSFEPTGPVDAYVRETLERFLDTVSWKR